MTIPSGAVAQKAIAAVESFKTRVRTENQNQHDLFIECYELYAIKSKQPAMEPWLSRLKPTAAFEFVERAFSELTSNTPSFELEASSPEIPTIELEPEVIDKKEVGGDGYTKLKEAVKVDFKEIYESDLTQMFRVREMKKILRAWIKSTLMYGTSHVELSLDVVARKEYEDLFEEGTEDATTIIDKITPKPILVENFDILTSPFATDPEEAIEVYGGYGVTRNNVSFKDLDEDTYGNLGALKAILTKDNKNQGTEEKEEKDRIVSATADREIEGSFAVDEVWMYFAEGSELPKKKIIGVSMGQLIRFEDAEEVPFIKMVDHEVPGQYWGIGEIEPIKEDLYEETTLRNQRIDFNNRLLNEEWLLRSDAGIDPRQLVSKPGNIIVGDDISDGALRQVQRNTAALATSGEDIDRTRRNMTVTLSSTDTLAATGNLGGDTKTATGEKIRERNSVSRFNAKTENIEFAVAELARKMLQLKAKHLNENDKVPVFLRGKWREVDGSLYKEYIDKHMIRVRAGSMNIQNSETERNNKVAAKNIALEAKQIGEPINLTPMFRDLLGDFKGVDIEKVLPEKTKTPQPPLGMPPQGMPQGNQAMPPEQPLPPL